MSFPIFQNKKTPFQAIKNGSLKTQKIEIFPKGLTHGFGPKMATFPTFIFQEIYARITYFTIFQNEKTSFQTIKTRSFKSPKIDIFFKGVNSLFWSKNGQFFNFFFQVMQASKMSFTIFQNEKTSSQTIKTTSLKSRKIDILPKGLTHGFGPKMAFCTFFFLGNKAQGNVFSDILEQKNAFLGYK